jgi:hypothetical protein
MKFIYGVFIALGFLFILGAAGSDCDGKCPQNVMPIEIMLYYTLGGFALIILGIYGLVRNNS